MTDTDQITYREATMADHGVIVTLMEELIDELGPQDQTQRIKARLGGDIQRALESDAVVLFLAEAGSLVVGLSRGDILSADPIFRLRDDHRCGYVDQMFVRPAYRRNNIGRHLLQLCEDWFRSQGIEHCLLHAAVRAIRFYARSGYQSNREMFKRL